ncbi:unnamed protein product [Rhizoctonia solani]|uniref:F-box domain-containing protein n=1 Tax=Rhizoctonia solani TaxID=456999 RepID=A0A8H3ECJ1_9AGAM|nr:unnamed protein product [Rhizoctonia solani]
MIGQDRPTPEAVSLALQRSQATSRYRVLHLVAALADSFHTELVPVEHTGLPQYSTINIEARSHSIVYPVGYLLQRVLNFQDPVFLSELSLHQYQPPQKKYPLRRPQDNEYLDYRMSDEEYEKLVELLGYVHTLRLRNINIQWDTVRLTQLVHLHLQSVVLADYNELSEFLPVLRHAPRLQTLKLISVDTLEDLTYQRYTTLEKIALPKLESLVLADLSFNVLQFVLNSIAPGSHRTKVALTRESEATTYIMGEEDHSDVYWYKDEEAGKQELLSLLKHSNVDTLLCDSRNTASSAIVQWQDTGNKLSDALSAYLKSCTSLETLSGGQNAQKSKMATLIDISLKTLHIKLSDELSQSQIILARIHNKMSSQLYSLPNEILLEIFLYVVYTPGPDEPYFPEMKDAIKRIFWRLHCLMSVCSTWRNRVIELPELWTVIPIAEDKLGHPTPEAVSLALQRSQATPRYRVLHLAAALADNYHTPVTPLDYMGSPQYSTINIEARSKSVIYPMYSLLRKVLKSQYNTLLLELSLHQHQSQQEMYRLRGPREEEYLECRMSDQERISLAELLGYLPVLRLRNINIHWNTIALSHLEYFHLQSVMLGDHNKLAEFLYMLRSAPKLQTLKLISVGALENPHMDHHSTQEKIALPRLESLVLADLSFNVLQYVLTSIAPGSHRTKVALTRKSEITTYNPEGEDSDVYWDEDGSEVGGEEVLELLERAKVDTLVYEADGSESPWISKGHLRRMLRSLPNLKSLVLSGWKWDLGDIRALERPRSDKPFPSLSELHILDTYICEARYLPRIAASHSLQTLVLNRPEGMDGDHEKITRQLRRVVPNLRFVGQTDPLDEFYHFSWRFW